MSATSGALLFCGILLILASIAFAGIGLYTMYAYSSDVGRIVVGDAYNYIIIATRGVGWICIGIICAFYQ